MIKRAAYLGVDELKKREQCDLGDDASVIIKHGILNQLVTSTEYA